MKDLQQDIKSGQFRHIYLLYGTEDYLKFQYRDRLVSALLPGDPGMNLTVFDGDHFSETAVIDQAETLPFFAEHRVLRLDYTNLFKYPSELIIDYIKEVPDYLYIIFTESEVDRRGRMFKAVQKAGRCVEFAEQEEAVLAKWAASLLGKEGLRIRASDMEFLLERTGPDMNNIVRETDKLIHYASGRGEVTREDILAVTCNQVEDRIFDMITAVTEHRQKKAMELYADLLALKEPPMRILAVIGMQFNRMLMVKELSGQGLMDAQIAKKAGMPPFAVKKQRRLMQRWEKDKLREAVAECVRADEDIKSGKLRDTLAVELLLIKLSEE